MNLRLPLLIICSLISNLILAQKTTYFDSDWNETNKENASFYRTTNKTGNLFLIKDFFITGELQYEGVSKTETEPFFYEGTSKWYSQDQTVMQEVNFKNNQRHGKHLIYYSSGTKKSESTYHEDQAEGLYRDYFPSGEVQSEGTFKNNSLHGKYTRYSSEGVKSKEIDFVDGLMNGSYVLYNSDGKIFNKGTTRNGFKEGTCYDYYYSGELRQKYTIKNKLLDGDFIVFNTNGDTTTIGKFDAGKVLSYMSTSLGMTNNSKFSSSMELVDSVENWKTFRDGKLILESYYTKGKKTGIWNVYNYDGSSIFETRDYANSDCSETYLQKEKEDGFDPFFLPTNRFDNSNEVILDDDCDGVVVTRNEDVVEDLHPFYFYKNEVKPISEKTENSNIVDYKEYAYSEEFLEKNNCISDIDFNRCSRTMNPYTYKIFTSESLEALKKLKNEAQPKDDEIYFYYQTFEEREYDLNKGRPSRYMGFELHKVTIESLNSEIITDASIVKTLESEIFRVEKFSGLSAFDALEKAYKK